MKMQKIKEKIKKNPKLYKFLYPIIFLFRLIVFRVNRFMFLMTKYHLKLKKVKLIARNKRCFVIGNGPSLTVEDLERLKLNEEICFASNGICGIFDKTEWKPNVYAMHDGTAFTMVQDCLPTIIDNVDYLFLAFQEIKKNNAYMKIQDKNNIYPFFFNQFNRKVNSKNYITFSYDISKYIGDGGTVTCTLIQIAIYMGYKEIYLLGVDHNFRYAKNSDGKYDIASDHFVGAKNPDKSIEVTKYSQDIVSISPKGYELCKKECSKVGIKIYNATRGGKLEVFERVNFDDLFDK